MFITAPTAKYPADMLTFSTATLKKSFQFRQMHPWTGAQ